MDFWVILKAFLDRISVDTAFKNSGLPLGRMSLSTISSVWILEEPLAVWRPKSNFPVRWLKDSRPISARVLSAPNSSCKTLISRRCPFGASIMAWSMTSSAEPMGLGLTSGPPGDLQAKSRSTLLTLWRRFVEPPSSWSGKAGGGAARAGAVEGALLRAGAAEGADPVGGAGAAE